MEKFEIERKFLIKSLPDTGNMKREVIRQIYADYRVDSGTLLLTKSGTRIEEFRPPHPSGVVRIRLIDFKRAEANIKIPHGNYQREIESEIMLTDEIKDMVLNDNRAVEKERFSLDMKNHSVFCDRFTGRHDGIIIQEIEFFALDDAQKFLPDYGVIEIFPEHKLSNRDMYFSSKEDVFKRIKELQRQD
ncbi:MAG: hypothetical protein PHW02_02450 [bacterium]|nr:hypothetical protein [bacterium]